MERKEVKMYSDYKSPFAYLAFDPAFELERTFAVTIRWIPFQLRIKGKGERSVYSEYKARYSYLDARRWARARGIVIRGPLKVYDTTPALVGGLFARRHGRPDAPPATGPLADRSRQFLLDACQLLLHLRGHALQVGHAHRSSLLWAIASQCA